MCPVKISVWWAGLPISLEAGLLLCTRTHSPFFGISGVLQQVSLWVGLISIFKQLHN